VYGIYPWWPANGDAWIHPEDRSLARRLLPGSRVFRRDGRSGSLYVLSYGKLTFRVRPTMWLVVPGEGIDVGQRVEVKSLMGKNRPGIGYVGEMVWQAKRQQIRYRLLRRNMLSEQWYRASDLRPI
jgi:hypothetical protein